MLPTTVESSSDRAAPAHAAQTSAAAAERLGPGTRLGGFTLMRQIGAGGMGRVFEARQESLKRVVAVKVMGRRSDSARRRFEFEAKLLASLRHPGIAQIFEVGVWEAGGDVPWFAMEYVSGARTITSFAANLPLRERLKVFRQACMAVAHGHQRGVIHRDLKPGNILVDGSGQAKVIDFGVARTTDSDLAVTTMRTEVGQLVGTLQYMSPEQFDADPHDLDIRSDVYALGAILHELLAGRPPYDLTRRSVPEAARIVREEEPPRLAVGRGPVPRDLDVVVRKAMAKDRTHRYGSALELAADIDRFLQGRAVSAREPGVWETLRWAARRHRAIAGGVLAAFVTLAAALTLTLHLRGLSLDAELSAETARRQAEANLLEAEDRGRLARAALDRLVPEMHVSAVRHALAATAEGRFDSAHEELETLREIDPPATEGRLDRRLLEAAIHPARLALPAGKGAVNAVATDPQGRLIAAASADGTVHVWRADDGGKLAEISGETCRCLAIAPDGRTLAGGGEDGTIRLWDLPSGAAVGAMKGHAAAVRSIAFLPSSRTLASGSSDGTVRMWDLLTHASILSLPDLRAPVVAVAASPDGRTLATCTSDRGVRLWNADRGTSCGALSGVEGSPSAIVFSPDGARVAVASRSGSVQRWTFPGTLLDGETRASGEVHALAWVGEPSRLIAATDAGAATVPASGVAATMPGLPLVSTCVTAPADGRWIACAGADGTVRVLDAEPASPQGLAAQASPAAASLSTCGVAAIRSETGAVTIVAADGTARPLPTPEVTAATLDPQASRVAVGTAEGSIEVLDARDGTRLLSLEGHVTPVRALRFSDDGARLASSGSDGSIRIWPLAGGDAVRLDGHAAAVEELAFGPDGLTLASLDVDRALRLWNVAEARTIASLRAASDARPALAFDGPGLTLACGLSGGRLQLWDLPTRKELGTARVADSGETVVAIGPHALHAAVRRSDGSLSRISLGSRSR